MGVSFVDYGCELCAGVPTINLIRHLDLDRLVVVGSSAEADNLSFRHQLAVLQRQIGHRSHLTRWDRLLFTALYRFQPGVLRSISIVQPETGGAMAPGWVSPFPEVQTPCKGRTAAGARGGEGADPGDQYS